jgi:hypothetical protein
MKSVTALVVLAGLGVRAQQAASPHEAVVKDMIAATDKLTGVLATIKDAASAEAARPELKKAADDFLAIRKKAKALPEPNQKERDRLQTYAKKLKEAVERYFEERGRVVGVPGGRDALRELAALDREPPGRAKSGEKKK